jgi:hypothetical protein
MITTPEQIDIWRQSPSEHQRLEFKEAKTQVDNRRLYEYCVRGFDDTADNTTDKASHLDQAEKNALPLVKLRRSSKYDDYGPHRDESKSDDGKTRH